MDCYPVPVKSFVKEEKAQELLSKLTKAHYLHTLAWNNANKNYKSEKGWKRYHKLNSRLLKTINFRISSNEDYFRPSLCYGFDILEYELE